MKTIEIDTDTRQYVFYDEGGRRIATHPFSGFPAKLERFISKHKYLKFIDSELSHITLTDKKYDEFLALLDQP